MNQPIRVLNLFTIMNRGGAETLAMNYYRNIDRTKVQFDFMVHRQERGVYDDEIEALGGRIFRMSPITLKTLSSYRKELRDFFNSHPEYKILHAHMSEMAYFVFKEAKRHNIPVRICHAHSMPNFSMESFKEKLKVIPRICLVRLIRPLVTDKFCCSEEAGKWLFGDTANLVQMNNAVDASLYRYDETKASQVKKLLNVQNKVVWGHVGRLIKIKNQKFIIRLFDAYHKRNPNSALILIGQGEDYDSLKSMVEELYLNDSVFLLGSRNDVSYLLQGIDVFVFPSLYEGLPVSLIEAQSAGIPCVVSDRISSQTHITDGYYQVSLNAPIDFWEKTIEKVLKTGKKDTYALIKEKGFDINRNAAWLCDYYLNKHRLYE